MKNAAYFYDFKKRLLCYVLQDTAMLTLPDNGIQLDVFEVTALHQCPLRHYKTSSAIRIRRQQKKVFSFGSTQRFLLNIMSWA